LDMRVGVDVVVVVVVFVVDKGGGNLVEGGGQEGLQDNISSMLNSAFYASNRAVEWKMTGDSNWWPMLSDGYVN